MSCCRAWVKFDGKQQHSSASLCACFQSLILSVPACAEQGSVWISRPERLSRRIRTSEWTRWGRPKTIRVESVKTVVLPRLLSLLVVWCCWCCCCLSLPSWLLLWLSLRLRCWWLALSCCASLVAALAVAGVVVVVGPVVFCFVAAALVALAAVLVVGTVMLLPCCYPCRRDHDTGMPCILECGAPPSWSSQ